MTNAVLNYVMMTRAKRKRPEPPTAKHPEPPTAKHPEPATAEDTQWPLNNPLPPACTRRLKPLDITAKFLLAIKKINIEKLKVPEIVPHRVYIEAFRQVWASIDNGKKYKLENMCIKVLHPEFVLHTWMSDEAFKKALLNIAEEYEAEHQKVLKIAVHAIWNMDKCEEV